MRSTTWDVPSNLRAYCASAIALLPISAFVVLGVTLHLTPLTLQLAGLAGTAVLVSILFDRLYTARRLAPAIRRLTVTLANLSDGVITTDVDGRITLINPEAERLTGWAQGSAAGRPLALVFQIVDEDTRQPVDDPVLRVLRTATAEGLSNHTILLGRHGTQIPIEYKVSPIIQPGAAVEGAVLAFRDCSRHKQIEAAMRERALLQEQLAKIADTAPGVICAYRVRPDGSCSYPYSSPRIQDIYGMSPDELARDASSVFRLIHPEDVDGVLAGARRSAENQSAWHGEYRVLHPDRGEIWVEGYSMPEREPDGSTLWRGFLNDVTDRKRAEERYVRQRDALVALAGRDECGTGELGSTFRRITEEDAKALGVARVSIWRYSADRSSIRCVDLYELQIARHSSGSELPASAYPAYFAALSESDAIVADDVRQDPRTRGMLEGYLVPLRITSIMDTPIHVGGIVDGVLCHEHVGPPRTWTTDEKTFAIAIASQAALDLEGFERRRAETALRASEVRYRQIVETAQEGIWTIDTHNKTTFANPKMAAMLGYSAEEVIGADLFAFMDDGGRVLAARSLERHVSGTGEELEFTFRRKDGTPASTIVNWTPITDELGRYAGALAMISDVSLRKQKDEEMRLQAAALNAAADAMLITDRKGTISWVNPAFTTLTGYAPDEAIGKNPRALVKSGAHERDFYRDMWDTILTGHVWRGEMMNRRKDGTIYAEHQSITPVKQPGGGEISHFIAIKRDLTEEKQLQAQFLQAQKMEIVGRLAGGIAHDFNNLLTVINGTAEFGVTALKESDPLRGDFLQIQQAGTRAATLTRQLLAFSRRQIMTLDVLNLKTIIDEMQGMLQRLIGEDIDLVVAPGKDVGNVRADAGQIEQVVLNLAVNARDAMPRGGRLTIEMQNVDFDDTYAVLHPGVKPGPHVMLAVSDSGTGMDAATRARIFEPFFTTKGPGKGTGLGLATVYGIVNQSGGSIRVYSEPGCGTTFKIYLPRIDEAAVSTRNTEAKPAAAGTETVLIVEDEEALRNLAVRILRSAGYQVLTARTGSEALQVIGQQNGSVQIVFTDVVMPEMGGRELAMRIAESSPDIKVLFSSGYTDDAVLRHGVVDNASHFIGKPYTRAALTHAIRDLLDQP